MADEDPLSLADFLERSLADDTISGEAFLAGAAGYQELKDFLEKHPDIAPKLLSPDAIEARQLIQEICDNPGAILGVEGPVERGVLANRLPVASDDAFELSRWARAKSAIAKRREETAEKVDRFVKILEEKKLYGSPEETKAARKELDKPIYGQSLAEIHAETRRRILARVEAANAQEAARAIDEALTQTGLDQDFVEESRVVQATTQTMLENPDIANADIIIEAKATGRSNQGAADLARMATVVDQSRGAREGLGSFGRAAGDIATTVFPGLTTKNLPGVFAQAWDTATGNSEKFLGNMTQRLGSEAVKTEEFRSFIKRGNQEAAQHRRRGGFGNIFSAPRATTEDVEDYTEALWRHGQGADVNIQEFFLAKAHKDHHLHFHFEPGHSPLDWILSWGAKGGLGTKTAVRKVGTSLLTKIGLGRLAGMLGGPVGWAAVFGDIALKGIGTIVSKITSGGILGAGTAANAFGDYFRSALNARGRYKDPFASSWIIIVVGLAFAIPFLATWGTTQVWHGSLINGVGGAGIPGQELKACDPATDPTCLPLFCDSTKQSCKWPTPCGCITSPPGHGGLNGIDIGTRTCAGGTDQDIYASCDGKINYMYMGLGDGEKCTDKTSFTCGYGYGNYIDLYCNDGKTMFRYAHILKPGPGISQDASVKEGQVLGYVDDNGNSTGPHLHYEYCAQGKCGQADSGTQNIAAILPPEMAVGYCY